MAAIDRTSFETSTAHGFFRVAACVPNVTLGNPAANVEATCILVQQASARGAGLIVFPELGLSGYSNDDLFFQDALLDGVEQGIAALCEVTRNLPAVLVVGAPLRVQDTLFNCGLVLKGGKIICVYPKTYLPNYREFYEKRYFSSGLTARQRTVRIGGNEVLFGNDILVDISNVAGLTLHVEICEDVWVPSPPSTRADLAGASVLVNLSASNATIAKNDYRHLLVASQSGRCIAAYVYCAAGFGESTTDLVWDGHAMIYENGDLLAESRRFNREPSVIVADVDLDRLRQDRARMTSFADCADGRRAELQSIRRIDLDLDLPANAGTLERQIDRFPFVPSAPEKLSERCADIYAMQVQSLAKRLNSTNIKRVVIGVSGGADSAQALIVAAKAFDFAGLPRAGILGFDMPGFATSVRTRENANALMRALGVTAEEIDIRPSALQMLRDIGHPYSRGEALYDLTFENVQAGERTSHLFRLANLHGALVVGTSDLSELALGYTTYGVGDQMSHYAVNVSIPKTLIRHLLAWCADNGGLGPDAGRAVRAILETPASPELVPTSNAQMMQRAEAEIGPYALHDFFLYYLSRFGYRPSKVAYLAEQAWADSSRGSWPEAVLDPERVAYDLPTIKHWLGIFIRRFFETSQFKRSALPNGPKIGSGGSLSPRGDWRAPSDCSAEVWLAELAENVP